jgi:hypothetical protein
LFVLSASANFCYRQSEFFASCPAGATEVQTIEDIEEILTNQDNEVILSISNDETSPFIVSNGADIQVPFNVVGLAQTSCVHFIFDSEQTKLSNPSFSKVSLTVEENATIADFPSLTLDSVTINDYAIVADVLTSDPKSLQTAKSVTAGNLFLTFSETVEPTNLAITLRRFESSLHINKFNVASKVLIKGDQTILSYADKQTPICTVSLTNEVARLVIFAEVNSAMNIDQNQAGDKITIEPTLVGTASVLTLAKDTGKLTNGRTLTVNGGKAVFPGGPFHFNVVLKPERESTFEILDGTSVNTITAINHKLNIPGKEGSTLFANNFNIIGTVEFVSDNKKVLGGFNIVVDSLSKLLTTNLDAKEFNNVEAMGSSEISSLGDFGNDITLRLPFSSAGIGSLTVKDTLKRKTYINLYQSYIPDEKISHYETIINKDITLLCSENIQCDNVDVNIQNSDNVWSFTSHFTKEKIIFEKTCSDKCVGFKILENPINVYEQFGYGDNWSTPVQTIRKLDSNNFNWQDYVTENTKGVLIMAHENIPDASIFDLSKANFKNKIDLRIIKSPFSGAIDGIPTVKVNADSIKNVRNFEIKDMDVTFTSANGKPKISTETLTITNSLFPVDFTIDTPKLSISNNLVDKLDIPTTTELTVYPTSPCDITFTNDGWFVNDKFVKKDYSLKVHAQDYKDYRVNMLLGQGATNPLPIKFAHNGNSPTIFIDKAFENVKNMQPFSLEAPNWDMMISVNGSYVPVSLVSPYKLRMGVANKGVIRLAEQKLTNGAEVNLYFVDDDYVNQVVIPKFTLNDPLDGSKQGILNSHKMILIEQIDVQTSTYAQISTAVSNLVKVATTPKTQFYNSNIKKIEVSASAYAIPTLALKDTTVEEIFVDIPSTITAQVAQKDLIVSETTNIASLVGKINLSTETVTVNNKVYKLSVELVDQKIVIKMTEELDPSSTTSVPTSPPSQKLSDTGIIVSISIASVVLIALIVAIVIYIIKKRNPLRSEYTNISNDPMINNDINVTA